ncbi:unnamed protein product [Mytilus coruscus]|uniref:Ig-like domain-containing protein n=1 Tax=Mytilus coruscus TaxID=42192 RepID=A0A6J8BVR3_MYTCO|nr:unnamed protein product [Mytilus coruscus]
MCMCELIQLIWKLSILKRLTCFDEVMKIKIAVVFVLTNLFAIAENLEKTLIHTTIGDTITLECPLLSQNLSAQWVFLDTEIVLSDGLQINPKINNETSSPKFKITGNPELGEYNLKINDVDIQDKGDYKCDTEINGKPMSKFFSLIIGEYPQINNSDEYTTAIQYQKSEGFSVYKLIMIFMSVISCIFILPLVAAGLLKVIRSNHGLNETDTDIERAPAFLYETVNDTGVIRPPLSGPPRSNITNSRPSEHTLEPERSVALYADSSYVQSRSYATQLSVHISDIFLDNADSETSSTQSLGTNLGLVCEPPYINHYHPLVRSLGLQKSSINYDDYSLT